MSTPTALLVFAQPVAADALRKRLAGQPLPNRQVLTRMNRRIRQIADATGLPVLHSTDLIAHTGLFGEQLDSALRAAFGQGFERVVVVGNDCPALTTAHLMHAATELQSASVVLGPDTRGGLYLLGLSRQAFERLPLYRLPWQTNRLAKVVTRLCTGFSVAVLPRLSDVNSRADLYHYPTSSSALSAFIRHLLAIGVGSHRPTLNAGLFGLMGVSVRTGTLRGPPAQTGLAAIAMAVTTV